MAASYTKTLKEFQVCYMIALTRTFEHQPVGLPSIVNEDTDNGRFYCTPDGNRYRSVTTFLGLHEDSTWLDEWKERVGEEEVAKRSTQAKRRGTAVHSIIEQYLLNNKQFTRGHMPANLIMFSAMRKILDKRIGVIRGLELGLWSDQMRIAGRTDMLAEFDGVLSIVDFKTSKWPKDESKIHSYYLQTTIYAMMVEELMNIKVPQLAIIIGVDDEDAQVFIKDSSSYRQEVLMMVSKNLH